MAAVGSFVFEVWARIRGRLALETAAIVFVPLLVWTLVAVGRDAPVWTAAAGLGSALPILAFAWWRGGHARVVAGGALLAVGTARASLARLRSERLEQGCRGARPRPAPWPLLPVREPLGADGHRPGVEVEGSARPAPRLQCRGLAAHGRSDGRRGGCRRSSLSLGGTWSVVRWP